MSEMLVGGEVGWISAENARIETYLSNNRVQRINRKRSHANNRKACNGVGRIGKHRDFDGVESRVHRRYRHNRTTQSGWEREQTTRKIVVVFGESVFHN